MGLREYRRSGGEELVPGTKEEDTPHEFVWAGQVAGAAPAWPLGALAACLLRRVCTGRLLPSPWLNKVSIAFNQGT